MKDQIELNELATLTGHSETVYDAVFSADGTLLATSSKDKTIRLWEIPGGRELGTLEGHTDTIYSLAFSSDGSLLASASGDKTARLWEVQSRRALATLKHKYQVEAIALSPDGTLLASASGWTSQDDLEGNVVTLWEVPGGRELATFKGVGSPPKRVTFSPDGSLLASGWYTHAKSSGGMIKLWEMPGGREVLKLTGLGNTVADLAFSPNGSLLAAGLFDKSIKLLKMPGDEELTTLGDLEGDATAIAFSYNGTVLAAELSITLPNWSNKRSLCIWEVSGRRPILVKHGWEFSDPVFSPDGSLLVTTDGKNIRVWGLSGTGIRGISPEKQSAWAVSQAEGASKPTGEPARTPRKLTRDQVIAIMKTAHDADEPADLVGDDLSGIDLSEVSLKKANLAGANLSGANLTRANLDFAKMAKADLTGANLTDARLLAEMEGANLSKAVLSGATIDFAQLQGANLSRTLLDDEASLRSADLAGANLTHAILWGTHIQRANLTDADLTGANLTGAFLEETIMPDGQTYHAGMSLSQQFGAIRRDVVVQTLRYPFVHQSSLEPDESRASKPPVRAPIPEPSPAETATPEVPPMEIPVSDPPKAEATAPEAPLADFNHETKEILDQDEGGEQAQQHQCPNCGGTRFSYKPKSFYKKSGKPVSRFIDLFGGGFMTILGIGLLWLTLANWKTAPSPYLLVSGFGLLLGGLLQLIKYLRSEKIRKFHYQCIDCRHQWQLSEAEQAQVDATGAIRSAVAGRQPVEKTEKPFRRKWLWLAVFAGLILILVCGAIVGALPAILGTGSTPSEQKERLIASPTTANEIAARPTNTSTATVSAPTEQPPANTPKSTDTPEPTDTPTPEPTNTPVPTQTPTEVPPSPPAATPLPGTETIPLADMASSIPWLPMDESNVPCNYFYGFNVAKYPFDNRLVRQAFALAVDRQAIANLASNYGFKQPRAATVYTPPEVLGRDLYGQIGLPFNIDRARELLAQAGFPDGGGLPQITLTFNNTGSNKEGNQAIANAVATKWREQLGANVVLESVDDWNTYLDLVSTDAPQIFRLGWCADYVDPDRFLVPMFHSAGEYNRSNFANAEFDRLVEQAAIASIPATRQAFYIQAEQILVEQEAAVIPLFHLITSNE